MQQLGDSIWAHEQQIRFGGLPLWHRMTAVALSGGGIVLHSPTRIDAALKEAIHRLGPVVAVIAPSWWHDLYLRETLQAFPKAALYGAPTLARWEPMLPFAGVLGDSPPRLWKDDLDQQRVKGIGLFLDEVAFHHRASRSLIVADLLFNISPRDAWITRTLGQVFIGPYPGCRFARLYRPLVFDRRSFRASIERMLAWDFDQIIVGHGAVVQRRGINAFRDAFRWLLK